MTTFRKTLAAGFAALSLGTALTMTASSEAEARWRYRPGYAIGAGVVGALALGAIIASQPRPVVGGCYRVRKSVWSPYLGAFVVRRVTVCE